MLVTHSSNSPFWTVIVAAPTISQVVGVIAAVVFAGIIFLLQQAPPSEDSDFYRYSSRALITLLYVFLSLVIASVFYSVVSGEEACKRAFTEATIASALFSSSAVGTFLSMCWLFAAQRIGGPYVIWAKILMFLAGATAWIFTILSVLDATQVVEVEPQGFGRSGVAWWGMVPFSIPIIIVVSLRMNRRIRDVLARHAAGLFNLLLSFLVATSFVAVISFSILSVRQNLRSFPVEWRSAVSLIVVIDLCLYFSNMMIIRRAPALKTDATDPDPLPDAQAEIAPPLVSLTINIGRRRKAR